MKKLKQIKRIFILAFIPTLLASAMGNLIVGYLGIEEMWVYLVISYSLFIVLLIKLKKPIHKMFGWKNEL